MDTLITGKAYVLGDNIDTDQIIPAQYLTYNPAVPAEYKMFGKYALSSVPPSQAGLPKGHVPFHTDDEYVSPYAIIVAGKNFGCGSSREHAPWALHDYGIRCLIAPSYADIFYNNCFNNSILPVTLAQELVSELFAEVGATQGYTLAVDLPEQTVTTPSARVLRFEIDGFRKDALLKGLDNIGWTLSHRDQIGEYENRRKQEAPWLFGVGAN
jgi:3-isopropylmalate/(R)-2-methylmalate dehydratase small subunit